MCEVGPAKTHLSGVVGFVDQLVVAAVNSRIYWPGHPRVRGSIENLLALMDDYCVSRETGVLRLGVVEGYLIHDRRPLLNASLSGPRIVEPVERLRSGGIEFHLGMEEEELAAFLKALVARPGTFTDWREANRALEQESCRRIRFLPEYRTGHEGGADSAEEPEGEAMESVKEIRLPVRTYQAAVTHLQDVSVRICRGDQFALDESRTEVEEILTRLDEDPVAMLNLARYNHYDAFTFGHSVRVSFLALNFARHLTADTEIRESVGLSAMLHDVGKARVPFEILHSKGRLNPEERREMERHTTHGAEILLEVEKSDFGAVATAFGHHRTIDGAGYPGVVVDFPVSAVTRIVKICDVFEALTAVRPYKAAMTPSKAYRIMLTMEGHFDFPLLRRFVEITGIYPIGTTVILESGERALVRRQTSDLRLPEVEIRTTPDGDLLDPEDRRILDLRQEAEERGARIAAGPLTGGESLAAL